MKTIEIEIQLAKCYDSGMDIFRGSSELEIDESGKYYTTSDGETSDSTIEADWIPAIAPLMKHGKPVRAKLIIEIPDREVGFYWVKLGECADWRVAEWDGKEWYIGLTNHQEESFTEIDERRIERVAQ